MIEFEIDGERGAVNLEERDFRFEGDDIIILEGINAILRDRIRVTSAPEGLNDKALQSRVNRPPEEVRERVLEFLDEQGVSITSKSDDPSGNLAGLFDKSGEWVPYEGPEGGVGWRNQDTDEIVYQEEPPGNIDTDNLSDEEIDQLSNVLEEAGLDPDQYLPDSDSREELVEADLDEIFSDEDPTGRVLEERREGRMEVIGTASSPVDGEPGIEVRTEDGSEFTIWESHAEDQIEGEYTGSEGIKTPETLDEALSEGADIASRYFDEEYGLEVDLNPELDDPFVDVDELVEEVAHTAQDLAENSYLENVSSLNLDSDYILDHAAEGRFDPATRQLDVASRAVSDAEDRQGAYDLGMSSTPRRDHALVHEAAHSIHHGELEGLSEDRIEELISSDTISDEERELIESEVSEDAAIGPPIEFIAETTAGLLTSEEYSDEIMELYEQYHGPDVEEVLE